MLIVENCNYLQLLSPLISALCWSKMENQVICSSNAHFYLLMDSNSHIPITELIDQDHRRLKVISYLFSQTISGWTFLHGYSNIQT